MPYPQTWVEENGNATRMDVNGDDVNITNLAGDLHQYMTGTSRTTMSQMQKEHLEVDIIKYINGTLIVEPNKSNVEKMFKEIHPEFVIEDPIHAKPVKKVKVAPPTPPAPVPTETKLEVKVETKPAAVHSSGRLDSRLG